MDWTSSESGDNKAVELDDNDDESQEVPSSHGRDLQPNVGASGSTTCCAGSSQTCGAGSSQTCGAGSSRSLLVSYFIGMNFPKDMVIKAINENGEDDENAILEALLTYKESEKSSASQNSDSSDSSLSASDKDFVGGGFTDTDSENEEHIYQYSTEDTKRDKKLSILLEMGYTISDSSSAIKKCGDIASIQELTDFIHASQVAEESSENDDKPMSKIVYCSPKKKKMWTEIYDSATGKKRRIEEDIGRRKRVHRQDRVKDSRQDRVKDSRQYRVRDSCRNVSDELQEESACSLPNPMVGFGLPTDSWRITRRKLPEAAIGPPYFYYENVALAPRGTWQTISRFLHDVEPEFVDSKYFCAAARKRGYVHNLPLDNRYLLKPIPPKTIHEVLPLTKKWWPKWDKRTQLNCLQTCVASAKMTERIRSKLARSDDPPPQEVQQYVINECRKWNLVWVGLHKVAPLEPDEIETILGFPKNHTRGGGISRTERYRSLGNSFQVDTVAYHLSVLKEEFPNGINVLSLFSGIGGAEVALGRLGIHMKTVVSVEKSEINRNILRCWWEQTGQTGTLIDIADVQQLNGDRLEQMISTFGGFDLVIGGSPCNNLTGSNRISRDGLEGEHSSLFYDYFRILDLVKCIMGRM